MATPDIAIGDGARLLTNKASERQSVAGCASSELLAGRTPLLPTPRGVASSNSGELAKPGNRREAWRLLFLGTDVGLAGPAWTGIVRVESQVTTVPWAFSASPRRLTISRNRRIGNAQSWWMEGE